MGSPRIISRPALAQKGGTGTGGSGTGGVAAGGYDRYIGTIGSVRDTPTDVNFPHYLDFPAAQKYDWIRAISETTTTSGVDLLPGQEFVCGKNNTIAGDLSNWEYRTDPYEYYNSLDIVGSYVAKTGGGEQQNEWVTIQSDKKEYLPFRRIDALGGLINRAPSKPSYYLDVSNLMYVYRYKFPNNNYIIWDLSLNVEFATDPTGDRFAEVRLLTYEDTGTGTYQKQVEIFYVTRKTDPATQGDISSLNIPRAKIIVKAPPSDPNKRYFYTFVILVQQSSGINLSVNFLELTLTAFCLRNNSIR